MISFPVIPDHKEVVFFELDNVLYPQKDYDLQVYYLFANFIEYLETSPPANDMIEFVQKRYQIYDNFEMFKHLQAAFGISEKYAQNLALLKQNAKLPLKLLLYKEAMELLQELVVERKQLYLITKGEPAEQLNKITQTDWHGLDKYLKVYFLNEFNDDLTQILSENSLKKSTILWIGNELKNKNIAANCGIDFVSIS